MAPHRLPAQLDPRGWRKEVGSCGSQALFQLTLHTGTSPGHRERIHPCLQVDPCPLVGSGWQQVWPGPWAQPLGGGPVRPGLCSSLGAPQVSEEGCLSLLSRTS